VALDS
jgi:hypothetical protein